MTIKQFLFTLPLTVLVLPSASCQRADQNASTVGASPIVKTIGGVEMVLIPGGKFKMGSNVGAADQSPQHEVTVDAFLMDRYEVTQEQYERQTTLKSHFKGPKRPVEMISWADAATYCNLRSKADGLEPCYDEETAACNFEANGYRLPTEAEWEYACRAGSTGEYSFAGDARSLPQYAWFAENSAKQTHPVGEKKPNAFGLYDMNGNAAEWCNDMYDPGYYKKSPDMNPHGPTEGEKYVLRGGAWSSIAENCGAAARTGQEPGFQDACFALDAIGFRCVKKAEVPTNR